MIRPTQYRIKADDCDRWYQCMSSLGPVFTSVRSDAAVFESLADAIKINGGDHEDMKNCEVVATFEVPGPTPAQLKLAARLLDIAAEKFSNHICNDFDLVKQGGLTVEEAREIQELVNRGKNSGLSVADVDRDDLADVNSPHGDDWLFMYAVAKALKEGL